MFAKNYWSMINHLPALPWSCTHTSGTPVKLHKPLTSAINEPPLFAYRNYCFDVNEHNGNDQLTHFNVHFNVHLMFCNFQFQFFNL